jgi:hypothetical protein
VAVDVPGVSGPEPEVLAAPPTAPHLVSWTSPGGSWWAGIDGQGLHGWNALTQPQVAVPPSLLPVGEHVVTVVTCDAAGCSNHYRVAAPVAGTVTAVRPAWSSVGAGVQPGPGVVTIQPPQGAPVQVRTPYAGLLISTVAVGSQVAFGQSVATVVLGEATQEQHRIVVG